MLESFFPYIFPVHVTVAISIVGLILYTDSYAFSWLTGKRETLEPSKLLALHRLMWTGLITMIITGGLMFYPYREYLLSHPPFLLKAGFVVTLVVNAFFIGKLMHTATLRPFVNLNAKEKLPLFVSGGVSTLAWAGAIIMATMLNL
jgi:hypothetical protein